VVSELEGKIVRYSSVSRSPTLGRNEKVEQHIRKKTHRPNTSAREEVYQCGRGGTHT